METAVPNNAIACRLVLDGAREHLDTESEVGMIERSLLDYLMDGNPEMTTSSH